MKQAKEELAKNKTAPPMGTISDSKPTEPSTPLTPASSSGLGTSSPRAAAPSASSPASSSQRRSSHFEDIDLIQEEARLFDRAKGKEVA